MKERFSVGKIVATPSALAAIESAGDDYQTFLNRHERGDWGDVDEEDRKQNEEALAGEARILSVYRTSEGVALWIVTEADRSATTILLPEEY